MKECITHHHACDCREAEFKSWKAAKDEWKARAERAEADRDHWRQARHNAMEAGEILKSQRDEAMLRAERAVALLREALTELDVGGYWPFHTWRAKVRDLLEGGNDKG